jgi:hypothetical protein
MTTGGRDTLPTPVREVEAPEVVETPGHGLEPAVDVQVVVCGQKRDEEREESLKNSFCES